MRFVSVFAVLAVALSPGCSRPQRVPGKAGPEPPSATAPASAAPSAERPTDTAGPRVELTSAPEQGAEQAPALSVVDGPGLLQKIRDSGHQGVVINIWASWCDPCREELPMLARVAPQLAAQGVPVWLVSVDEPASFPAAKELLASLAVSLPSFGAAPPLQDFKLAMNPKWPGMIPVSFLFDATGKLRYFWRGEVFEQELLPIVKGFVAGEHIDGTSNFGLAPGATEGPPR
jgi:thiol-disulfide isomerase/thioredoxin